MESNGQHIEKAIANLSWDRIVVLLTVPQVREIAARYPDSGIIAAVREYCEMRV